MTTTSPPKEIKINLETTGFKTQEEALHAQALSYAQEIHIKNCMTSAMTDLVNLAFKGDPVEFASEQGRLRGEISAYQYLLSSSAEAQKQLNDLSK